MFAGYIDNAAFLKEMRRFLFKMESQCYLAKGAFSTGFGVSSKVLAIPSRN
jgi:hypothetical protein